MIHIIKVIILAPVLVSVGIYDISRRRLHVDYSVVGLYVVYYVLLGLLLYMCIYIMCSVREYSVAECIQIVYLMGVYHRIKECICKLMQYTYNMHIHNLLIVI